MNAASWQSRNSFSRLFIPSIDPQHRMVNFEITSPSRSGTQHLAYITWKSRIAVPKVSSDFAIDEDLQLHVARIVEDICGYSNCFPGIISQIWDNIRANKSIMFSHGIILCPGLNIY